MNALNGHDGLRGKHIEHGEDSDEHEEEEGRGRLQTEQRQNTAQKGRNYVLRSCQKTVKETYSHRARVEEDRGFRFVDIIGSEELPLLSDRVGSWFAVTSRLTK